MDKELNSGEEWLCTAQRMTDNQKQNKQNKEREKKRKKENGRKLFLFRGGIVYTSGWVSYNILWNVNRY